MASYSQHDFPFGIMDVVELLHLRIRRPSADSVYVDCPFCGDFRGKMNVNHVKDTWRCNYCGESGGMLALYARLNHTTTAEAYREICDALLAGEISWGHETNERNMVTAGTSNMESRTTKKPEGIPQSPRADAQKIHDTYTSLLQKLLLKPKHKEHLCSEKRGLTEEQIEKGGFKSTPPFYLCRSLTEQLIKAGCTVEGVPGFYLHNEGYWTVNFNSITAGILLPCVSIDGRIQGLQILLDHPIKDEGAPPEKAGTKYLWLSSSSKNMGVSSGSPAYFVGSPGARTVYVTEGILKAYIAHGLMNRSFAAIAGANNTAKLDALFGRLAENGTELIMEAHDMDKYNNKAICQGSSKIYLLARKHGMECRRLVWNPNYKGIDDWQLALRRKAQQEMRSGKESLQTSTDAPQKTQRFRFYQLDFGKGQEPVPFAFKGMEALHKAGYEQPPAALYRLTFEGESTCPKGWPEEEFLRYLKRYYGDSLPEGYSGRPLALSDVVELYDDEKRRYYYVDTKHFEAVRFSPFLAKPAREQERTMEQREENPAGICRDA